MASELTPTGPVYTPVWRAALGSGELETRAPGSAQGESCERHVSEEHVSEETISEETVSGDEESVLREARNPEGGRPWRRKRRAEPGPRRRESMKVDR